MMLEEQRSSYKQEQKPHVKHVKNRTEHEQNRKIGGAWFLEDILEQFLSLGLSSGLPVR